MVAAALPIRPATPADSEGVAAIYAHHVRHGTASYDSEPRSVESTAQIIADHVAMGWPFLVAQGDGGILGYAYATQFRPRDGYAWTCEDSVYVHPEALGRGIGTALLDALVHAATASGFRQMVAVIGGASPTSIALHRRAGFAQAGRLKSTGRKHGRWLDTVYMQRALGEGDGTPPADETA
ncbi:MAG TPA: N-acetyltransferase family protein [Sphingopyxis sp.]|nr:N-acetyltransferase family protein [Sphingopyxis sp.]HMP46303.1 N-acetyltransferase family protein [Sphingopyxis sp.]HMQ19907.1 N-acetyltransferase family protein [Sphingopyxis sp.]